MRDSPRRRASLSRLSCCLAVSAMCLLAQETFTPKIQLTGALEADAAWNFDYPAGGVNQGLGFTSYANQLRLSEATLSIDGDLGRVGFRLDGGAGDFYRSAMSADSWKGPNQYISQAYLVWKPNHGTRVEAGKFFSTVGAEVAESYQNFNTTRSLLFWYAEPLYHVGVRASTSLGDGYTAGAQLLSGCNTVTGAHGHQTMAVTAARSGKHWGWSEIYMDGNEKLAGSGGRHLSDTILTFTGWRAITGYAEGLAAVEKRATPGYDQWYGWATAWRISPLEKWSLSPRLDWLDDRTGATTGWAQRLFEYTITAEYRPRKFAITRLEYRDDRSNRLFYPRASGLAASRHQPVLAASFILLLQREL